MSMQHWFGDPMVCEARTTGWSERSASPESATAASTQPATPRIHPLLPAVIKNPSAPGSSALHAAGLLTEALFTEMRGRAARLRGLARTNGLMPIDWMRHIWSAIETG